MKTLFNKLKQIMHSMVTKISMFFAGTLMILSTLLGIKQISDTEYDIHQIVTAGWTFLFGIPILLVFFHSIYLPAWAMLVIASLMLVNLDEALMLFYLFSEHGVKEVRQSGDYQSWIQEIYYSSTFQQESSSV